MNNIFDIMNLYDVIQKTYIKTIPFFNIELFNAMNFLKRNESLSYDELNSVSLKNAKNIVKYAFENSTFYNKKYSKEGFHPNDFKTWSDFQKLPILEKHEIRENRKQIITKTTKLNNLIPTATGGSTGEPLQIYHDKKLYFWTFALYYRQLRWQDISIKDKHLGIWRTKDEASNNVKNINLYSTLRYSNFILDARKMTESSMDRAVKEIFRQKPKYIYSYVGGAEVFADYILKNRITLPNVFKAIFTTSSPISESIRLKIEKAFNTKVIDQYGSTEILSLACEKDVKGKLYTFSDLRKIETVNNSLIQTNNHESGSVLVTDYVNKAFPLIRYRNGDMASFYEKEPTIGLPSLNKINGRVSENFSMKNELIVDGSYLTTIFDDIPHLVKRFLVKQESKESILFKLETESNDDFEKACRKIVGDLDFLIKDGIKLSFSQEKIESNDAGKVRYIIKMD